MFLRRHLSKSIASLLQILSGSILAGSKYTLVYSGMGLLLEGNILISNGDFHGHRRPIGDQY